MGPHSVTCHPAEVTFQTLPSQSWYSITRPRRDAGLSWPSWLVTYRDGIPARSLLLVSSTRVLQSEFIVEEAVLNDGKHVWRSEFWRKDETEQKCPTEIRARQAQRRNSHNAESWIFSTVAKTTPLRFAYAKYFTSDISVMCCLCQKPATAKHVLDTCCFRPRILTWSLHID